MDEEGAWGRIALERGRQDAKWGGPNHDDTHTADDWKCILTEHAAKAYSAFERQDISVVKRIDQLAAIGFAMADCLERLQRRSPIGE